MADVTFSNQPFLVREMGQSDKELVCANNVFIRWQHLMSAFKARSSSNTFSNTVIYGRRGKKRSLTENDFN